MNTRSVCPSHVSGLSTTLNGGGGISAFHRHGLPSAALQESAGARGQCAGAFPFVAADLPTAPTAARAPERADSPPADRCRDLPEFAVAAPTPVVQEPEE